MGYDDRVSKENGEYRGDKEKKEHLVHAPYNFVPFSERVQLPYEDETQLPRHDRFDPEKRTGEIRISLTAETPVFVSNGERENPHFFQGADGSFMIPGSTIRGLVRENVQILGFGRVQAGEDLEDYQIFFRKVAAARDSTDKSLQQYYHNALEVTTKKSNNQNFYSIPQKVSAGYICCEGKAYKIYPANGNYLRVSRKCDEVQKFNILEEDIGESKRRNHARTVKVFYLERGGEVEQIQAMKNEVPEGMKAGVLLYTGEPVNSKEKPNCIYLFPEIDRNANPVVLSKEDVLSYIEDWEKRKNSLEAYYDSKFWKLPDESEEPKPVFYARYEGHTYCGMSLFLRIGYRYPLSHGLPDYAEETDKKFDYPHAMFGFAKPEGSYRSRVSFGDLKADKGAGEMEEVSVILGEPKPSYYPGYVTPDRQSSSAVDYNEENFKLRGYKQYWFKADVHAPDPGDKKRVATILRPLPSEKTKFRGVIRYKNLTKEELGLLLWALRLEEGCFQGVGMGKPYGFGRVKVEIEQLTEYDLEHLYGGELYSAQMRHSEKSLDIAVDEYIHLYQVSAGQKLKRKNDRSICEYSEIQDFFFLKSSIQSEDRFSYMSLEEYKNTVEPLPTVWKLRKEEEKSKKEENSLSKKEIDVPKSEEEKIMEQMTAWMKNVNTSMDRSQGRKRKGKK